VQSAAAILRSATSVNAEILMEPQLGKIQPGCYADILIVDGDPLGTSMCSLRMADFDGHHEGGRVRQAQP
jgi:imidazolonepropionase-like amidohydrolase